MLTLIARTDELHPDNDEYGRCSECHTIDDFGGFVEHLYVVGDRTPAESRLTPCPKCDEWAAMTPATELLRLRFEG